MGGMDVHVIGQAYSQVPHIGNNTATGMHDQLSSLS